MEEKIINYKQYFSELCVDCVYWCPIERYKNLLAVGLYQLDSETQKTKGGFTLFYFDNKKFELLEKNVLLLNSGVLDLKWIEFNDKIFIFSICEDGTIKIHEISDIINQEYKIVLINEILIELDSKGLYIDIKEFENQLFVLCSCEINFVALIKLDKEMKLISKTILKNHEFTPWVCAFSHFSPNIFVSGGDDLKLNLYDINENLQIIKSNKSEHTMGITALLFDNNDNNVLFSGSYDQKLRIWDIRNLKNCVSESKHEGGIWRIRQFNDKLALALSFGNKCEIIKFKNQTEFESIYTFKEHDSLAYGIDWYSENILSSCSFYDKKINIFKI